MSAVRSSSLIGALGMLLCACSQVDYIEIDPAFVSLSSRKDSKWLSAKAMSHTKVHYPQETVTWSVKDLTIASVDEKGRVTPLKSGRTEVVARHGEVTASVPVEVKFAEKLTVSPSTVELTEGGGPVELTVKVFDYQGRELKERVATFQAKDKQVVSMGQNAAFPLEIGETIIEVRVEDLLESVPVKVSPERRAKR